MPKSAWPLVALVAVMIALWVSFTGFQIVDYAKKTRQPSETRATQVSLESIFGAPTIRIESEISYNWPGGEAAVLRFDKIDPAAQDAEFYITAGISAPPGKPNNEGRYEICLFIRPRANWGPHVLQNISIYTKNHIINPGDFFSLKGLIDPNFGVTHLFFVRYGKPLQTASGNVQPLLAIAVTPDEMAYGLKFGPDHLLQKLIDNKIYPVSYLGRSSTVDMSLPMVSVAEGIAARRKREQDARAGVSMPMPAPRIDP